MGDGTEAPISAVANLERASLAQRVTQVGLLIHSSAVAISRARLGPV